MGESGDLLLIFADALIRSWKQITKFKPVGAPTLKTPAPHARPMRADINSDLKIETAPAAAYSEFNLDGLIRDERGVRLAPESED
jgi:cyanophycin synthetase